MASYQTYSPASHFRHPWFDAPVAKRKHPVPIDPSEDMDDEDEKLCERSVKRARYSSLETGLAHLSLDTTKGIVEERETTPRTTPTMTMSETATTLGYDVVRPGSVEEPEGEAPEIQMGISSWYEPEPDRASQAFRLRSRTHIVPGIVITDLDAYVEEDEEEGEKAVEVNGALLEHIQRNLSTPSSRVPQSRALVLFRPLFPAGEPPRPATPPPPPKDEDAMDLDN
mgnify:CR=1 FL=1